MKHKSKGGGGGSSSGGTAGMSCPAVIPNNTQGSSTYNHVLQEAKRGVLNYPSQPSTNMPSDTGPDSDSDFDSDVDTPQSGASDKDGVQVDVDDVDDDVVDDDDDGDTDDDDTGNAETGGDNESQEDADEDEEFPTIVWTGYGKRVPVIVFKAESIITKRQQFKSIGEKYHLAYKIVKTESKLIRSIFDAHGFNEAHPNSNDFNLMWTGSHLKPYVLRSLQEFQKVNHFPRSYEITRKDRLFKNIQRMQQTKGYKNFDFVPMSFIIPGEFQDFCSAYLKDKGPYIVKPIASSRGRGIFLVNHPEQVPLDETLIVSKYIASPLLIDGFKFDVRLYVAVTSYDPLVIYMYEEGLTRFATVKYEKNTRNIRNTMMHLTNYSVNKKSQDYVKNDDPDVEDFGNKWSLGALLRYLRSQGRDTTAMMMRTEDVIIKTILSAELPIATACKMFMPYKGNCFEVYGFDILVDENLRPWILEVNLSPSLACDAPIDLKIKSNMLADLFSLVGFVCHDPMMRKVHQQGRRNEPINGKLSRQGSTLSRPGSGTSLREQARWKPKTRPGSAGSAKGSSSGGGGRTSNNTASAMGRGTGLNSEEIKVTRRAKEEYQRRGGWIRIFPSPDSWEIYSSYMQYTTTNNLMLWQQLFPDRAKSSLSLKPSTAAYSSNLARAKSVHLHSAQYPQLYISTQLKAGQALDKKYLYAKQKKDDALAQALQRSLQYERKLSALGDRRRRKTLQKQGPRKGAPNISGHFKGSLVQGVPEDTMSVSKPTRNTKDESTDLKLSNKPVRESTKIEDKLENKTEVVGKPPIKRTDSKISSSSSNTRVDGTGDGRKDDRTTLSSKANQQQDTSKSNKLSSQDNSNKKVSTVKSGVVNNMSESQKSSNPNKQISIGDGAATNNSGGGGRGREEGVASSIRSRDSSPAAVSRQPMPKYYYNVVELLEKGKQMTKVQARHAFATYLTRVQQRLLAESIHTEVDDIDQANEQMDLVLRFLKRAAGNLQQPFKVVVPSRKLALNDRRRILAKQLGDFVHIYNKETEQLRHRNMIDTKCLRRGTKENNVLDEDRFNQFVHTASESELEEVLTTYTKLNKSASIFLGSNSKTSGDKINTPGATAAQLERRREQGTSSESDQSRGLEDLRSNGYYSGSTTDLNSDSGGGGMGSNSSLHRNPSQSSFHSAVAIYSTRLGSAHSNVGGAAGVLRQRPSSASSQWSANSSASKASLRARPSSATVSTINHSSGNTQIPMGIREGPDGAASDTTEDPVKTENDATEIIDLKKHETIDPHNEEAINSALQRIAMRQQQRQYIASKGSNVLAGSAENTPRQLPIDATQNHPNDFSNGNVYQIQQSSQGGNSSNKQQGKLIQTNVDHYPIHDNHASSQSSEALIRGGGGGNYNARPSSKDSSRSVRSVRSANDTFNSFVNDSDQRSDEYLVTGGHQSGGVNPMGKSYTPTFQSTQYQIAQHQIMLKQQRMIEQSKALLEQSKAKHQAMIAQAHAAQKGIQQGAGEDVDITAAGAMHHPKPPLNPAHDKKTIGSHRMARTQMLEDGYSSSSGQFYNSIKYDSYTGTTAKPKVVYSSAYNTGL